MNREEIKNLIAKAELEKAIQAMIPLLEGQHKAEASQLLIEYKGTRKMEIMGIATGMEIINSYNKITMKALTIADEIAVGEPANHVSDV